MTTLPQVPELVEVEFDPFAGFELARAVPSTEAQREVWLADRMGREASLAFNESVSLYLRGPLDQAALEQALVALANRHESLRLTISDDGLSLLIGAQGDCALLLIDLAARSTAEQESALAALRIEAVETPFDLATGPLFRAMLVRRSIEQHELILTAHHIVCDGWAIGVLARELMVLYATSAETGNVASLPAAESFGDYALAQYDTPHLEVSEVDTRWWVEQFRSSVPVLDLPQDRPRPAVRRFESRREELVLDAPLVAAIKQLGSRQGASLFATMFATFGAVLSRLSGQDDLVIGVPAAGQSAEGLPGLVGHCVQFLPIRMAYNLKVPFASLLKEARSQVLDAFEHQSSTLGAILKHLRLARDPSRLSVASIMFNLDVAIRTEDLSQGGLQVDLRSNPRRFENFELFLNACQHGDEIILECQYNTGLFDALTVQGWLALYREALKRAATNVEMIVADLFEASDADRERLQQFNATAAEYRRDARIGTLIDMQAAGAPGTIAIMAGEDYLTYRDLQNRTNALAHLLRARGLGRGALVGICVERGIDMIVAQIAILKAGAAYVPLDPAYPTDRLSYMAEDAGLSLLVSQSALATALPWPRDRSLWLDADRAVIDAQPSTALLADARLDSGPQDPAYVIYTSGSTGKPKGVAVPHQAVVNFLASMAREPGLNPGDRLAAVTTLSFDIAVLELLLPLTVGACVVLASREQATDGQALRILLEESGARVMQATPASWRLLLDAGWNGGSDFKALIGGEALPADLVKPLLARTGELWNMYGPTETTVWSTCWKVVPDAPLISIGRPIANTSVWILDEHRRPCPIGVSGEMFIGGDGLALGYLHRPELTAEKFVADPFCPGKALYRTGDRGRWRHDGLLEHLGRLDFQVKVRGFRIELGEIEANLAAHPQVARAVVIVREDRPGDVRLAAYLVAKPAMALPGIGELRDHLKGQLPEYMVPQHFTALQEIPLLPNGKLNRHALPVPDLSANPTTDFTAPATELEKGIAEEFEAVLGIRGVGLENDFFTLGGHSLLAAQLIYRLNRRFASTLPMRAVFEAPTVAKLARLLSETSGMTPEPVIAIVRQECQSRFSASAMQERLWRMEKMVPGRVVYHAPSAHRLRGPLNELQFERAFREIIRRQASLRTQLDENDGGVVQIILNEMPFALFPAENLSTLPAAARENRLADRLDELTAETFELRRAPLFRAKMFRLAEQEHVLFFMPHHIIWDGWSFDIFYQEISAIYEAYLQGRRNPLAELPVSYGDFSVWHRAWSKGPEHERQVAFWRERMIRHGNPAALPIDKPRRSSMTGTGHTEGVAVDHGQTQALHELASKSGATMFAATLAVYSVLLHDYSRQKTLVIGTPVRARNAPELEGIMGFFNNLLLLHIEIVPAETFVQLLMRIKALVIECFAHPDAPLEELARELPAVAKDRPPLLYQALFSFQDARQRATRWGELEHSMIPLFQRGATEDLGMWFLESAKGLQGGITYNADILANATAKRLQARYLQLLHAVLESSESTIAGLVGPASAPLNTDIEAETDNKDRENRHLDGDELMDESESGFVAPRNDLEIGLATVWQRVLGVERVGLHDNFFDLGGNSLGAIALGAEMEKSTGIPVDIGEVFRSPTIAKLVKSMGPNAEKSASVVVPLQPSGNGTPIFCICGINIYADLAKTIGKAQPVFGVYVAEEQVIATQATRGEMPDVSIGRLVEAYYTAIMRFRPQGPYRLAGFSLGGILALELASLMRRRGAEVEVIVLLDTFLPQAYHKNWYKLIRTKCKELLGRVKRKVQALFQPRDPNRSENKEPKKKEDSGYALLRALAFEAAAAKWRPDPALVEIPIVLFQAADLSKEYPHLDFEEDYGWRQYFGGKFTTYSVPGDHLGILRPPNVEVLGRKAREYLEGAENSTR